MLPLKLSKVCIFTAPLEYLPSALVQRLILIEIVVESNAYTSLSISRFGMEQPAYNGRTFEIK
ncbi:MAG: hypothetical protein ACYC2P_04230 [Paludibacteraceae bacterium]